MKEAPGKRTIHLNQHDLRPCQKKMKKGAMFNIQFMQYEKQLKVQT